MSRALNESTLAISRVLEGNAGELPGFLVLEVIQVNNLLLKGIDRSAVVDSAMLEASLHIGVLSALERG